MTSRNSLYSKRSARSERIAKWLPILAAVAMMTAVFSSCSKAQPVSCGEGDITSTAWALQSYGPADKLQSPLEGTLISISFMSGGTKIGGSDGCNTYFGACQIDTTKCRLQIDQSISTTKKACDPPIAQQETKFLALLKAAQRYTISAGELRITAGKEVLVFVPYVETQ